MFHKISRIVKNISFAILNWQGQFLQKRLVKRLGYKPKQIIDGCTVDISQEEINKREKIDNDVNTLLKSFANDPDKIIDYLENNGVNVYKVKKADKRLKLIGEAVGFITERVGLKALMLNMICSNGLKFKTDICVVVDLNDIDIYILINSFYKWYSLKEKMPGFDTKSQLLLKKFNSKKNEDKLIGRLSIPEIEGLKHAISRDIQAIEFVSKYSRENAGAKNALEKMQSDKGASI